MLERCLSAYNHPSGPPRPPHGGTIKRWYPMDCWQGDCPSWPCGDPIPAIRLPLVSVCLRSGRERKKTGKKELTNDSHREPDHGNAIGNKQGHNPRKFGELHDAVPLFSCIYTTVSSFHICLHFNPHHFCDIPHFDINYTPVEYFCNTGVCNLSESLKK